MLYVYPDGEKSIESMDYKTLKKHVENTFDTKEKDCKTLGATYKNWNKLPANHAREVMEKVKLEFNLE